MDQLTEFKIGKKVELNFHLPGISNHIGKGILVGERVEPAPWKSTLILVNNKADRMYLEKVIEKGVLGEALRKLTDNLHLVNTKFSAYSDTWANLLDYELLSKLHENIYLIDYQLLNQIFDAKTNLPLSEDLKLLEVVSSINTELDNESKI